MQKEPIIKMTKKHGSAYVRDGKVEYCNREHYTRDLKMAKLFAKHDTTFLLDTISNIDKARNKIKKFYLTIDKNSTDKELIKYSQQIANIIKTINSTGLKMISIIEESNPTSSGKVLFSDIAFDMLKEFVIETKTRRDLIEIYGPIKARRLFSREFYNEIKIKNSL